MRDQNGLCASDIEAYRRCPRQYWWQRNFPQYALPADNQQRATIGKIVEDALAQSSADSRKRTIERGLLHVSAADRERMREEVESTMLIAQAAHAGEGVSQQLFVWTDPQLMAEGRSMFRLYAKPDETRTFVNPRAPDRIVQQLIDDKALAKTVKPYHRRILYFFGLVVSMCNRDQNLDYDIQLVVRLLSHEQETEHTRDTMHRMTAAQTSSQSDHDLVGMSASQSPARVESFWYSKAMEPQKIQEIRAIARAIDVASKTGQAGFVANPGQQCGFCPFAKQCVCAASRLS